MRTKSTLKCNSVFGMSKFIVFVISLFISMSVSAQFSAGSGTVADPYQITSKNELMLVGAEPTASFKLMNNIDMAGEIWTPIGNVDNKFTGNFDGNAKKISNIKIVGSVEDNKGFFGYVSDSAIIKNLYLENDTISGHSCVGGLVGIMDGGSITNCAVKGVFNASKNYAGGLVGRIIDVNNVVISNCIANVVVSGNYAIGGLVGDCVTNTTIKNCIVSGQVKAIGRGAGILGFCGDGVNVQANTIKGNVVVDMVITKTVSWSSEDDFHRIIGTFDNTKTNVLDENMARDAVTIMGLSATRNFTSATDSPEGLTKTASELQTQSVYEGVNYVFGNTESSPWLITTNNYPTLWFAANIISTGIPDVVSISMSIYPNPCKSAIKIKSDSEIKQIEIYSIAGILLNSVKETNEINVSNLEPAVYLIKIFSEKGVGIQKFIKE